MRFPQPPSLVERDPQDTAALRSFAFDQLSAIAAVLDDAGVILDTNEAWRLFSQLNGGSSESTGLGTNYVEVCERSAAAGCADAMSVAEGLRSILAGDRDRFDLEYSCESPTGISWFLLSASSAPVVGGAGIVLFHVDITARKALEQRLAVHDDVDGLTGLPNRRAAVRFLVEEIDNARLTDEPVTVVFLDLDGFKTINEVYGQAAGDLLLVKVASRMRRAVREADLICRFGSDEFVLVCPSLDATDAQLLAGRLRELMAQPFQFDATQLVAEVSVGVATSGAGTTVDSLLGAACSARYVDKARIRSDRRTVPAERPQVRSMPTPRRARSDGEERLLAELQASQAMADSIVAHSSDLVMMFQADGTIEWASPAALTVFGMEPDDLIGQNGLALVHPDDQERVLTDFAGIPGIGDHVRTEFRVTRPDGIVVWVEETATNLLDQPDVGMVVANIRDITARRAAEDAARFRSTLLAAAGQAIVAIDTDGVVIYWNPAATSTYGWTAEEAIGSQIAEILPAVHGWEPIAEEIREKLRIGEAWSGEFKVLTRDGVALPVMLSDTPVYDDDGVRIATVGVSSDISEQVELHEQMEVDRRRLADAQASARLGSFELDFTTGEMTRSDELWRILGRQPGSKAGLDFDHVHPDDRDRVKIEFDRVVSEGGPAEVMHRIVRPDGSVRWVISRTSPFRNESSMLLAGTMLDITEQHEAELALAYQATHDVLTGLPNRSSLQDRLRSCFAGNRARWPQVAVAILDLDQFKNLNDTFGHVVGDQALRAVAQQLLSGLPNTDAIYRFGGDEFVLLREGVDTDEAAVEFGHAIAKAFALPISVGERAFQLTASIGVARSMPADTSESLLRDADTAMYQAKADGRARMVAFDARGRERAHRRSFLETELRDALQRDQLHLVFQPVVELDTLRVAGFESLLRWEHPDFGLVGPDEFIPIAEATGLIVPIGAWVLQRSLEQLALWLRDPDVRSDLWMAINVSARQLGQRCLVDLVDDLIHETGVDAAAVHLEITESVFVEGVINAVETITDLHQLGVRISMDDFGTGYSSLSYLNRLPINTLKIDRSFVQVLGPGADTSIVRAIAALSDSLDLDVVAEGIETEDQFEIIRELGCRFGQGFLWSRPLPPAHAMAWARNTDGV